MSYGLGLAGDARADLRAMEPWLQEEFWDELDGLAADPSILSEASQADDLTYQFARDAAGIRHIVRIAISRNDIGRTLTVLGVAHRQRAIDG